MGLKHGGFATDRGKLPVAGGRRSAGAALAVRLAAALLLGIALTALVRGVPVAGVPERLFDDLRIAVFAPSAPAREDIVILAVTEETLAGLPYRSPVDRGFLAELVDVLAARGVRAIGVDLLIDRPSEPAKDQALRARLGGLGVPVVMAGTLDPGAMSDGQRAYHQDFLDGLDQGFANLLRDPLDGVVRRLAVRRDGRDSFAAALAAAAGRPADSVPDTLAIDWSGRPDPATPAVARYPAAAAALLPPDWLAGRVALIGLDLSGTDRHRTPFDLAGRSLPGVTIHAHALAQLLDGRRLARAPLGLDAALSALAALAGIGLARLVLGWSAKLVLGALVATAMIAAAIAWHAAGGGLVTLTAPLAALAIGAGLEAGWAGRRLRAERRFIRDAFARYVSPAVVARLEADPGQLRLSGERRICTFLFTDLAGFTTLSEGLSATDLADLLNRYLDGLSACVLAHDGTVDKFVGDGMMAFFGAPLDQPDHADRAIACAAAIARYAEAFRRETAALGVGATRIGVYTGAAVVGNIGGSERFQFTAVGDAVNTAARLEQANGIFSTAVCVGDTTRAALVRTEGEHRLRPIGRLVLKGKRQPVAAFELVPEPAGPELVGDGPSLADPAAYDAAWQAMAEGRATAAAAFGALAAVVPEDPLVRYHARRLADGATDDLIALDRKGGTT